MDSKAFKDALSIRVEQTEKIIDSYLPEESGLNATVAKAMNYSVLAGGKRLRPIMLLESYRAFSQDFGEAPEMVKAFMVAMECIHTYSLVHDDLPAMDNDEYRRGKETTWKVFGDAMGVLAGDGLLNYAFELMSNAVSKATDISWMKKGAKAMNVIARKAGMFGMIGGQCADLLAEGKKDTSLEDLLYIHEHKTACLIQASLMAGAILANADEKSYALMEQCGYDVGIAFQIQDDILDVCGDSKELGKMVGSDAQNDKVTYVTLKGLEASTREVSRLSKEALDILADIPGEHEFLEKLIASLVGRKK